MSNNASSQNLGPWELFIFCYRNAFNFSGRSSRSEFWYFFLFYHLILLGTGVVCGVLFSLSEFFLYVYLVGVSVFVLISLIPALSVAVRRLHDIGYSGLWMIVIALLSALAGIDTSGLLALIFLIVFIVVFTRPSEAHDNKYGSFNQIGNN